ncbi:lipopolysaccharide biosynthesis protein [Peribacillus frigoritolerans]|uniref:lipopolysaccharide biosynthesis protein n=1 Tax=Peribacillus frigoritolerans TaxID=450367 RepID=UPI0007BEEF97|nr:polysaccharide biosynthesis C-terminal domain-containing protein [Peribacillus frigoritolerans]
MRTKNVLYSLLSSFVYQFTYAVFNLITLRLFLSSYGSEVNGLSVTIIQVVNYMNIVEAGIALTGISALYKPLVQNDYTKINSILSACNELYRKSGFLFLLITLVGSISYPFLIESSIPYYQIVLLILIMSGGSIVEYFLYGKMRVLLVADQKSYIINSVMTLTVIIASILKIYAINLGFSFLIVQAIYSISVLIRVLLTKIYISRNYSFIKYNVKPDFSQMGQRWSVLYHQIAGLLVFNSPLIIISIFCSLKDASKYAVYNLVFSALITILQLFSKSVVSSFGNLINQENNSALLTIFRNYESIFYLFTAWLYCVAYLTIEPFIQIYTNGVTDVNYIDPILSIMFIVVGLFNAVRIPLNSLIEASGHYEQTRNRAIIEACINICVSIIMVQFLGLYGVLCGSVASYIYRSLDIILYSSKNILHIKPTETFIKILMNIFLLFLVTQLINSITNITISSWISWIVYSFIISIVVGTTFLIFGELTNRGLIKNLFLRMRNVISK